MNLLSGGGDEVLLGGDLTARAVAGAPSKHHQQSITNRRLDYNPGSSTTFERIPVTDAQGLQPLRFEQVSCTTMHALAVTTGGALFSWGCGVNGPLGNGSTENEAVSRLVRALEGVPIASAAAGYVSSLALARSGEI